MREQWPALSEAEMPEISQKMVGERIKEPRKISMLECAYYMKPQDPPEE